MKELATVGEVFQFLHDRRKYWLGPIIIMLVLFGFLIMAGETSGLGPFVYSFF